MVLHLQFSSLFTDWKRVLHIIFTGAQHYRLVVLTVSRTVYVHLGSINLSLYVQQKSSSSSTGAETHPDLCNRNDRFISPCWCDRDHVVYKSIKNLSWPFSIIHNLAELCSKPSGGLPTARGWRLPPLRMERIHTFICPDLCIHLWKDNALIHLISWICAKAVVTLIEQKKRNTAEYNK